MKRFYKIAAHAPCEGGHGIKLDDRPVRTPGRALLAVPGEALAAGIAAEWNAQGEDINPAGMPMTGLANAAIDQIAPDPVRFAHDIAAYGESDLLCYRADAPEPLVARQAEQWQPLLDWAAERYEVRFAVTQGIVHVAQPQETLARLTEVVEALDPFTLAALFKLVAISGSLIIGLAAIEKAFPLARLWQAAELDELWQAEQWGDDDEALGRRVARNAEFMTAAHFAELVATA